MVRADSVRAGDKFFNEDGLLVWTAVEDAHQTQDRGKEYIGIQVRHSDGGRETRLFDLDVQWKNGHIRRAHGD